MSKRVEGCIDRVPQIEQSGLTNTGASIGNHQTADIVYTSRILEPTGKPIVTSNLLTDFPSNLPEELFTSLLETTDLRIERIVSHGHSSPDGFWYDQDQHEWVLVLRGAARLSIEGEIRELKPGDYVHILAHQKHRVEWTATDEPTVWLAVFYGEKRA